MSQKISLKEAERKAFRSTFQDGLWDVLLGCFPLQFAIAPLLSSTLGDFWSSMIFLPFWGLAFLAIWLVRKYVVSPRAGMVKFRPARKIRLRQLAWILLIVNIVVLLFGVIAYLDFSAMTGDGRSPLLMFNVYPIVLMAFILVASSLAAYFLDFTRLYFYGLMLALAPLVGEWLYRVHGAAHHGFPITFGFSSAVMIGTGLVIFARFLRDNPLPNFESSSEEA